MTLILSREKCWHSSYQGKGGGEPFITLTVAQCVGSIKEIVSSEPCLNFKQNSKRNCFKKSGMHLANITVRKKYIRNHQNFMRNKFQSFEDASKIASLPMVSYNVHNLPNTLYMHQRQHSHQLQLFSSSTMILTSLVLHHVHHLVKS